MAHKSEVLKIYKIPKVDIELSKNIVVINGDTPPKPQLSLGYNEFAMRLKLPSNVKPQVLTLNPFGYPIQDFEATVHDDMVMYEINKVFNLKDPYIELDPSKFIYSIDKLKSDAIFLLPSTYLIVVTQAIQILSQIYSDVYIYKPFYSPQHNHDKYLICSGITNKIKTIKIPSDGYPLYIKMETQIIDFISFVNTSLLINQQSIISSMLKFIKDNNYYGEVYKNARETQIQNLKWWMDLMENSEYLSQMFTFSISRHDLEAEHYLK
jgi:hypothetical protein